MKEQSVDSQKPSVILPPISQLFKDSWELFKISALKLFILTLLNYGVVFGIALVATRLKDLQILSQIHHTL